LTGEGVSLAVRQAGAAVAAIVNDKPDLYEHAWRRITRNYRPLTRGLILATTPRIGRRAIVPAACLLPSVFNRVVRVLAREDAG
jgi:hypothetical protein